MGNFKKLAQKRLFLPVFSMILVMLINVVYDIATGSAPLSFFMISIKNGVLYGRLIDILNRGSEIAILAIGMTLVVSASGGTDISVGSVMSLYAGVCCMILCRIWKCKCSAVCTSAAGWYRGRSSGNFDLRYVQRLPGCVYEYPAYGCHTDPMVGRPCGRTSSLQQPDRLCSSSFFPEAWCLLRNHSYTDHCGCCVCGNCFYCTSLHSTWNLHPECWY